MVYLLLESRREEAAANAPVANSRLGACVLNPSAQPDCTDKVWPDENYRVKQIKELSVTSKYSRLRVSSRPKRVHTCGIETFLRVAVLGGRRFRLRAEAARQEGIMSDMRKRCKNHCMLVWSVTQNKFYGCEKERRKQ